MTANKRSTSLSLIETDDAPDLSSPDWRAKVEAADLREGERVLKRGRPLSETPKVATTIRLSANVITHFKAQGKGWQSRIDAALLDWIEQRAKG